ncbi:TNF receptor-associated factor 3-like isoform X2 [Ostrea edulis]|uniref:TNF receptor-associated factor 3-like isoform X2 n=1 Tax=Ostrea edulis TaxID=37623 RepID=UPI00209435AD|nr:TNF receptor-associated factor 3-like isoform X2 [Ostrea edulis]
MLTLQITPPNSLSSQTPAGTPEFVELDPKYVCILCNNVLHDAVQTPCGHRLCQLCADGFLKDSESKQCPYQEEMCEILRPEQIIRDASARRDIRQLPVYCTNKSRGCQKTVKWKDLEKHILECLYEPVLCPYKDSGCQELIPRGSLPEHQQTCVYTPTLCQNCGQTIPKLLITAHEKESCQKIPVSCEYGCGVEPVPRKEMSQHQESCPKRPQACKYASVGCTFQEMENYRQTTRQQVSEVREEIEEIKRLADDIKSRYRKRKLDMVELTERIIRVEKIMEECVHPEMYKRTVSDVNILRENIRSLKDRTEQQVAKQEAEQVAPITQSSSDPHTDTHNQSRQLGLQDARLAELDLRFQILETINYEGVLLWKIMNYRRRKQEAISGKTLSLYSSPFFTSRYGYKMCARVYLNGDGMGKGTHFSIFFVVMQGEYDALLQWPFRQKVTFMILDQSGSKRHLSDSFKPDPNSSSFKRPLAEMNIASGCPLFVSHSILESSTNYIRDDALFVKINVDTNGLVPI